MNYVITVVKQLHGWVNTKMDQSLQEAAEDLCLLVAKKDAHEVDKPVVKLQ